MNNFLKLYVFLIGISIISVVKAYPVDQVFTDNALGCNVKQYNEKIAQLYLLGIQSDTKIKRIGHDSLMLDNLTITKIKAFKVKDKNIPLSLSIHYKKDEMLITKLAFLTSPSNSEAEWAGYYYVLEGRQDDFMKFKEKYHLSSYYVTRTSLGNYRVTCIMVG